MLKKRKIPQRMCVGCRQMKEKRALIRIVRSADGNVEVDLTGKKSGKGAYICPEEACYNQAIKGKKLQQALEVDITPDLWKKIQKTLKI